MKKINKGSILGVLAAFGILLIGGSALAAGPAQVNLGSAGNFVILAKTGISTTGTTQVTGDIGVSPVSATAITGFSLSLAAGSSYATSALVTGKVYASDYATPSPTTMTTAIGDMQTAYTDGSGRTNPTATELGAGNIGGLTIAPGLYKWGTGVIVPSDVTLSGSANDVWIFQIAQTLSVSSGVRINLTGGAQASNVFWIVAGQVTIGTTANFSGNILSQTAIVLNTGARLNGRALAQTAVTLDSNAVTPPAGYSAAPVVIVTTPTVTTSSNNSTNANTNTSANNNANVTTQSNQSANVITTTSTPETGCASGNRFSVTTGRACAAYTAGIPAFASASVQAIRMVAANLAQGSRGDDVTILQNYLIGKNYGPAARALANVGTTAYFGALTRAALAEFQASVGISPALGNFGPITRAYVSSY